MRLSIFLFFLVFSAAIAKAEVQVVPHVDLTRYVGRWYEIASIPQSFQKQCTAGVTAEYTDLGENRIKVINSCDTKTGERSVSEGRAKVVDHNSNAKLKVTFVKFIGWVFWFGGDYWIIDLEPNYRYAVIGHPTRKYGWILSRNPSLSMSDVQQIANNLEKQGYDLCKFMMTLQQGGVTEKEPLCQYLGVHVDNAPPAESK